MTNPELQQAMCNHPADENGPSENTPGILPSSVREKLGLDIAQMAVLIGMSEFGYRNWEMGSRRPGGPAQKLLALLDAQPEKILGWLKDI